MKTNFGPWGVALAMGISLTPALAHACSEAEVSADVKQLGYWKDADDFHPKPVFKCFLEHGPLAAGSLIKELHPIPEARILAGDVDEHRDSEHVLWALRALYYMTGMDLEAGSASEIHSRHLNKDREYWILFHTGDQVNFFAVHPSTGGAHIAPEDVQAAVIERWKSWYAKDGGTFAYAAHEYSLTASWYEGLIDPPGFKESP